MSGSSDVREWAAQAVRFAADAPKAAAVAAADRITAQLNADTGGDGRLSRLAGGPATVALTDEGDGMTVAASGNMAVWTILEDGTKAHVVTARPGSALTTPWGLKRTANLRRGANAKSTWSKGAALGLAVSAREADALFAERF